MLIRAPIFSYSAASRSQICRIIMRNNHKWSYDRINRWKRAGFCRSCDCILNIIRYYSTLHCSRVTTVSVIAVKIHNICRQLRSPPLHSKLSTRFAVCVPLPTRGLDRRGIGTSRHSDVYPRNGTSSYSDWTERGRQSGTFIRVRMVIETYTMGTYMHIQSFD